MADAGTQNTPRDERLQRTLLQSRVESLPVQVQLHGLYSDLPVLEPNGRFYVDMNTQMNKPSRDCVAFTSACQHKDAGLS